MDNQELYIMEVMEQTMADGPGLFIVPGVGIIVPDAIIPNPGISGMATR